MEKAFYNSLNRFLDWLNKNGWEGYDPYDIKSTRFLIFITKLSRNNKIFIPIREILFEFSYALPVLIRKLLGIKPQTNAKAMGLFAASYLDLYKVLKKKEYLLKAKEAIRWLMENKKMINGGYGWGYPFDWQSSKRIPINTPNGIVTVFAGEAFWSFYKFTGNQIYLDYCIKTATFLNSLPTDKYNENICFSYTPLFINHVHNLNLFVAEYLIKIGMESNNINWIKRGNNAVTYTIKSQHIDGSFDYNGPPEKPQNYIDNYHTGFVLQMLLSIYKLTKRGDVLNSLKKCYYHYINKFFTTDGIPKLKPNKIYRIDIHSAAESISCLSELSFLFPESLTIANKVFKWTINNLQDNEGYFYYGILKSRITGFPYKSRIPYIRWGQAWMLKAFSSFLINKGQC